MKQINEIDIRFLDKSYTGVDNVKKQEEKKSYFNPQVGDEDRQLLDQFRRYYEDLDDFRERRKRNRKYYRGDQWSDEITDDDGNSTTEEDYIKDQGKVPLKQNVIRQLMKSLIGQQSQKPTQSTVLATKRKDAKVGEMLTNTLRHAHKVNHGQWLDIRLFEEYGLSGLPIQKIGYNYNTELDRMEAYFENVNPRRFIFNTDVSDQRLIDLRMVGELHDITIDELITMFASSRKEEKQLRLLYREPNKYEYYDLDSLDGDNTDDFDFYTPKDANKCRIIEIWYLASQWGMDWHDWATGEEGFQPGLKPKDVEELNRERIEAALASGIPQDNIALIEAEEKKRQIWKYKFLTPHGYCLKEGVTPFLHNEHPYAFIAYPLIDGEVWGFIEDVIDQQRYINRLITLMDFVISAGAKGVWLIPEESKPDHFDEQEYIDELVRVGGAVYYKAKPGVPRPEQVTQNSLPVGITDLLSIQMKLVNDISGIQPSVQGMPSKSGTPASLYAQEAQNAAINVVDYMNTFSYFKERRDRKLLKTIIQYYNSKRYLNISGADYQKEAVEYDPEMIDDLDVDVVVTQSNDTPIYRQFMDDMLFKLLEMQAIGVESFLENTTLPFADKLLETLRRERQEIQQQGFSPEVMNQVQGNPQAMNAINQSLMSNQNQTS